MYLLMLKYTGIKIQHIQDVPTLYFFEKGVRGGIVQCVKRFSEPNNKYFDTFDPDKPSTYLYYIDANNLYGWAMSKPLPYGDLEWVKEEDLDELKNNILDLKEDDEIGFML